MSPRPWTLAAALAAAALLAACRADADRIAAPRASVVVERPAASGPAREAAGPVPEPEARELAAMTPSPDRLLERALLLEEHDRYPEAIEAYDRLLAVEADEVVVRRRATLVELVRLAEELYREALDADDPAAARAALEGIQIYWPGFRDVDERLAALGG